MFKALIYSNLFVSLCAASLVWVTWAQLGYNERIGPMFGLIFFATLFVYNFDRLLPNSPEDQIQRSERQFWLIEHIRPMLLLTLTAAVGTFVCGILLPWRFIVYLVPLGIISLGYGLPIVPWRQTFIRPKDVPGLKIVLIALVWAIVTAILPAVYRQSPDVSNLLHLFFQRFIFIIAITLPFDVRDWDKDRIAKIVTLPHILGLSGTRALAMALMLIFTLDLWLTQPLSPTTLALTASAAMTIGLLSKMHRKRGELYYAFLMDGTMLLQWICVWILSHALTR